MALQVGLLHTGPAGCPRPLPSHRYCYIEKDTNIQYFHEHVLTIFERNRHIREKLYQHTEIHKCNNKKNYNHK